jgi:hypothetical protein
VYFGSDILAAPRLQSAKEVITIRTEFNLGPGRHVALVLFCEERKSVVIHHITGNKTKTLIFQTK